MATKRWIGNAPKISQVTEFVFAGTWEATDIVVFTIGGKSKSVVVGSTVVATLLATLRDAWNNLDEEAYPEFAEITASISSPNLILTMDSTGAGKPFTVTISTTETGGGGADSQTIDGTTSSTGTNSTTNSGPNVVSLAGNWAGGVAPIDGDDVIFDQGSVDVLYDLDQNGVTPASITILPGYTGNIGLPVVNEDNSNGPYFEYRETYLKYGTSGDSTNIAVLINGGGQRVKYSAGSSQATFRVEGTGQSNDQNVPACLLKGTHASNALHVSKGDVGFAYYGGETGTLVTLNVGFQTNVAGDASVRLGSGVTLTAPTITVTGGYLEINSAITSTSVVVQYDGEIKLNGTGGLAAGLAVRGGDFIYNSTGTLGGAPVVSGTGHLDFSQDLRAKTVTNAIDVYGDKAKISDPHKSIGTLVIDLDETANGENMNIGKNLRITRGAVA